MGKKTTRQQTQKKIDFLSVRFLRSLLHLKIKKKENDEHVFARNKKKKKHYHTHTPTNIHTHILVKKVIGFFETLAIFFREINCALFSNTCTYIA